EARDETGPVVGEGRHDRPQVIGPDLNVAVGQHDHVVTGALVDVDHVAQLRIGPQRVSITDERDVEARELVAEPAHDVDGGIAGIADAEAELKARIVLSTEAPEGLVEPGLHTAEGLQHTDRWRGAGRKGAPAPEDASTVRRPRPVPRRNERE